VDLLINNKSSSISVEDFKYKYDQSVKLDNLKSTAENLNESAGDYSKQFIPPKRDISERMNKSMYRTNSFYK